MLALLLLLGACGQKPDNSGQAGNTAGSPASLSQHASSASSNGKETSGAAETVTYYAGNGNIQVPKNPQRIVDLTSFYTGYFLALGAKPVGVMQGSLDSPYLKAKLDGVQSLGTKASLEKILELKPDLIITYTGSEGIEEMQKIAPVAAIEYGKKNLRDQMLDFGKLVGKEAAAKEWIASWDKKIGELKPKVQAAVGSKTVSILNPYAKGLYVFGHNYGRGGEILYGELGLKAPPEAQKAAIDSGTGWASISLEKLPDYAGDIIFTCPWSGDTSDPKTVYDSVIWKGLPAVKAGHVFQLNPKADTYNDPVSLEGQLKFLTDSLLSVK
ncbi:iron-hydroxamate ABC transporter substrate-binding protein [Paenibacillus ginsengarvi]|uniref:Iron-hydroxamate ABC transporter substrate-binding protein n=2 Tax=Paenibacillus ginsengarvi TaxID=400777 RepID=A0A3B0BE36_9BACL|nr:iron-hydroxamate ABC transporter substrate-binding protein [Paenibacillus ginsengarvi]